MKPGVFVINKKLTQTNISVGQLGVKRDNPDRYAIALMNFHARRRKLHIAPDLQGRSDEGLAYSVGSSFDIGSRDYGTFSAYTQTKTASTHRVLEIFREEFERIRTRTGHRRPNSRPPATPISTISSSSSIRPTRWSTG